MRDKKKRLQPRGQEKGTYVCVRADSRRVVAGVFIHNHNHSDHAGILSNTKRATVLPLSRSFRFSLQPVATVVLRSISKTRTGLDHASDFLMLVVRAAWTCQEIVTLSFSRTSTRGADYLNVVALV